MYSTKKILVVPILFLLFFTSCDVLQQVNQVSNLSKCDFKLESVQNLKLAGINVQNISSLSDLKMLDATRLAAAVTNQQFPLDFLLNIEAKNPNSSAAGITKIDWILLIDNIEMTQGMLDRQVTIPANNGVAIIPMQMNVDLKKVLSGKSADAILNFGLNLSGNGNKPTRFTLKVKPTITVNGFPITYPGYLSVNTEYASK